ncbi:MAG TPA: type II toxin-antitoxin system VapB family antitoxin [Actinocrinis sp.]|uniref:type II toxin-antitoxin system VapB family antitoxin n=1 Tax=Actinocrinis sp. TaxID=1920516 RepID=UPI002DDCA781|nr:type II toxin-antitoxin system VapB family antitoxin [Actinocrinis sp.]HEV2344564.1 type II toxin-antitoxin system VapB family antitoxin [Actinocrinis sp.]
MSKTLIDIDDDLLAEAAIAFGTTTKKDTVAQALQHAVDEARVRRRTARLELEQIADEGGFHFERYEDLDK